MTYDNNTGTSRAGMDLKEKKGRRKIPAAEQLIYASRLSGKSLIATSLEFRRLSRGRGRLSLDDYVNFSVMTAPDGDKNRFISDKRHWPIVAKLCDLTYKGLTEDKWLATHLMNAAGIPVPPIVAVIDKTDRNFLSTPKVSSAGQLRSLLDEIELPLFGKTNHGLGSFGAFLINHHDGNRITIHTGDNYDIDEFFADWVGNDTYILQNRLSNHSDLAPLSKNLITVRVGILNDDDEGILIPACCAKIPSAENIADNFWRPGNLIAEIDPNGGRAHRIRTWRKGRVIDATAEQTPISTEDIRFPFWDQVPRLAQECASLFHAAKYASLDVAFTPDGPIVVEANTGGSWELFQFASCKGFLTDQVIDSFRKSGVEI
jgi:Sugar-transfer associated ATP-grasp